MDRCADCGSEVAGPATYCGACADSDDVNASTSPSERGANGNAVATPTLRATAILLATAAVLGIIRSIQDLGYLPQVLSTFGGVDGLGYLLTLVVQFALLAAFAVMAKRLSDGTADTARYGRILQVLAVLSLASGVVVTVAPEPLVRWFPAVFDPAYVVLNAIAFELLPDVFTIEWGILALDVVGASITMVAATALRREP